jgi:predicted ester cyclase
MKSVRLAAALIAALPLLAAAQAPADAKQNEDAARHFFERANGKDIPGMLSVVAGDAKNFGHAAGHEGYRSNFEDLFKTYPDWHFEIIDTLAKGDDVVMRCKVSGTHRGTGRLHVAPTGKHFEIEHIHWWKLRDGKIVDHYATRDDLGMFEQLGIFTPPAYDGRPSVTPTSTPSPR